MVSVKRRMEGKWWRGWGPPATGARRASCALLVSFFSCREHVFFSTSVFFSVLISLSVAVSKRYPTCLLPALERAHGSPLYNRKVRRRVVGLPKQTGTPE